MPQIEPGSDRPEYQAFLERTGVSFGASPDPRVPDVFRVTVSRGSDEAALPIPLAQDPAGLSQVDLLRWVQRDVVAVLRFDDLPDSHGLRQAATEVYAALGRVGEEAEWREVVGDLCVALETTMGEPAFVELATELGDAAAWHAELPVAPTP